MNLPSCRDGLENGNGGIVKVHLNPEVVDRHQNAFPFYHLKQLDEKNHRSIESNVFCELKHDRQRNETGFEFSMML
jgi:hypothetical protein